MWGKIIGGAIGSIGSPIGIGIGAAIGHQLDRSSDAQAEQEQIAIAYMYILIASMAKMAKADGKVTKDELKKVSEFLSELGLEGEALKNAQEIFREEKDSDSDLGEYFEQFSQLTNVDLTQAQLLYTILLEIAKVDGRFHEGEMQILRLAEVKLRLPEGYTDREVGSLHDSRKHAAEVLGVSEAASKDEIQKAYRSKCKEMHPDALRRHGLPDELIKHAAVQIQSFTEARNVMLAAFN